MKATAILTAALFLALPLAAQSTDTTPQRDQIRKQDGTGTGTPTKSQLRKRDGSCGNPNPAGSRGTAQGARRGQNR
jgi:hypothetical protein